MLFFAFLSCIPIMMIVFQVKSLTLFDMGGGGGGGAPQNVFAHRSQRPKIRKLKLGDS